MSSHPATRAYGDGVVREGAGPGTWGAARAFKMVPVAAGSVRRVTGIEPGRAGMLTGFAGLSTPLVADACIRRKVPLRVAPPGIGAVIPGAADRRPCAAGPALRERRCVPGAAIQAWLARHPRFRLHFTPTGESWISQVERWFAYLTTQKIRRGVHKSVQALEADIRDWIENWNQNPRPFSWAKTAGEILDSLAKYLARISGAAY
jgi:hypothetical protein